ncbi:MAG: hypothetical protein MJZ31_01830 [Bacteroidales bacterium]|nr:hypothetical protein [Bacteroidales bacterium]
MVGYRKYIIIIIASLLCACGKKPHDAEIVDYMPCIYPDYTDVTIPVGIAPLNFSVREEGVGDVYVEIKDREGRELCSSGEYARFDIEDWHELVLQNQGRELAVTVFAEIEGKWKQYKAFSIYVSSSALDQWGITYRRVAPGYEVYGKMGIYQRDLSNFDERSIIENTSAVGSCVNCHTSNKTNPEQIVFHVRGEHGATMVQQGEKREWLKAKNELIGGAMVYPYWHPSGEYCAFSTNQTRQGFHVVKDERVEVFDLSSDILVYDVKNHAIITDTLVSTKDYSENIPVFSPDGKWIYYTTCCQQDYPLDFKEEKYDLCRISFDAETGKFGSKVDTLFKATAIGKSVTWPRPSYDGKYIMFTLIDYGYFSIWHKESDQYLLDTRTGEVRSISEINSEDSDSYHNWSENSHWVVFTSRRGDGLYSHLYLTSVGEDGRFTKPFLLPQENPLRYYSESLFSFNTPDFTKKPVVFDSRTAGRDIESDRRIETTVR